MTIVTRFGLLMMIGLSAAVALSFFDLYSLQYQTPTTSALRAFPFETFSAGLAMGIVLGFLGTLRWTVVQLHLAQFRRAVAEAFGLMILALTAFAILYYA
ncbi:MAG: hypothetical protein AAF732_20365 [Pseudomonadota bacterium]